MSEHIILIDNEDIEAHPVAIGGFGNREAAVKWGAHFLNPNLNTTVIRVVGKFLGLSGQSWNALTEENNDA